MVGTTLTFEPNITGNYSWYVAIFFLKMKSVESEDSLNLNSRLFFVDPGKITSQYIAFYINELT